MLYTRIQSCYLLSVPSGYIKVGVSDDVARRVREVQAQFYEPVHLECRTSLSGSSPVTGAAMERLIHWKLQQYACPRREWFRVDVHAAIAVWAASFRFLVMPVGHVKMAEELCSHVYGQEECWGSERGSLLRQRTQV